jgi:hypothetical protein
MIRFDNATREQSFSLTNVLQTSPKRSADISQTSADISQTSADISQTSADISQTSAA